MVDALKWGGAAYHGAGWPPRHIEGVKHFVYHALVAGTGKKFLHGQAVCLGLNLEAMVHGERLRALLDAVVFLGVDMRPAAMDVTWGDVFAQCGGSGISQPARGWPGASPTNSLLQTIS